MNNKETIQQHNETLLSNNELLRIILGLVENLPDAGGSIGDKDEYIQDGLISWWEGEDAPDENLHWNSRIGDDYIYQVHPTPTDSNNYTLIKRDNVYVNDTRYGLITNNDYWQQGVTIEVVGKVFNQNNSTNSSGGTLLAFDKQVSIMMQIYGTDNIFGVINQYPEQDMPYLFRDCAGKLFKYAITLDELPARKNGGMTSVSYALNNIGWYTRRTNVQSASTSNPNLSIMCYYRNSYKSNAEIYSIRIYNRRLTVAELDHNYKIDKKRFGLDEYGA